MEKQVDFPINKILSILANNSPSNIQLFMGWGVASRNLGKNLSKEPYEAMYFNIALTFSNYHIQEAKV